MTPDDRNLYDARRQLIFYWRVKLALYISEAIRIGPVKDAVIADYLKIARLHQQQGDTSDYAFIHAEYKLHCELLNQSYGLGPDHPATFVPGLGPHLPAAWHAEIRSQMPRNQAGAIDLGHQSEHKWDIFMKYQGQTNGYGHH